MESYSVYFAGDLFNHKDLIGNTILGHYLKKCSNGKYDIFLPQDWEQTHDRAEFIKNRDLKMVLSCDLGIYNFDGSDINSGVLVEYMTSKTYDIPTLLLRSDFRASGDGIEGYPPWNLMAVGYPRSKVLLFHSMEEYKKSFKERSDDPPWKSIEDLYTRISKKIIPVLDSLLEIKPIHNFESFEESVNFFRKLSKFGGESFTKLLEEEENNFFEDLVMKKSKKGLLSIKKK